MAVLPEQVVNKPLFLFCALQCEPYFDQDGCAHPGCSPVRPTPACKRVCVDGEKFGESKHYASSAYVVSPVVEEIQKDLLENGPLEVAFDVYEVRLF